MNTSGAHTAPNLQDGGLPPSRTGRLIRLRTKEEVQTEEEMTNVYVLEVPEKSTNIVLNHLRSALPPDTSNLNHLRRVCPSVFLPASLKSSKSNKDKGNADDDDDNPSIASSLTSTLSLHLFLCPCSLIPMSDLATSLSKLSPDVLPQQFIHSLRSIPVPLHAPLTSAQAAVWSTQFWPTTFKNTNPFGPHPSLLSRAEAELLQPQHDNCNDTSGGCGVASFMRLARRAGRDCRTAGKGLSIGAVVVERTTEQGPKVVAVAGDARWCGVDVVSEKAGDANAQDGKGSNGNPMGHAAMRVIGLVARKRVQLERRKEEQHQQEEQQVSSPPAEKARAATTTTTTTAAAAAGKDESKPLPPSPSVMTTTTAHSSSPYLDEPLISLEATYFRQPTLEPHGYLCMNLELYLTHEPCVMCSMAILHSRFGRVVFGREMQRTGALRADEEDEEEADDEEHDIRESMAYGMFWRPDLNWRMLCWRWEEEQKEGGGRGGDGDDDDDDDDNIGGGMQDEVNETTYA